MDMKKFGTITIVEDTNSDTSNTNTNIYKTINNKKRIIDTNDISIYFNEPPTYRNIKKRKY